MYVSCVCMCKVYKTENILRIEQEQIPYGSLNRAHRDVRRTFSRTKKSASQRDKAEQIESREMEQRDALREKKYTFFLDFIIIFLYDASL